MHQALVITCYKRDIESLLDALVDWKEEGTILVYGYTNKAHDGFIVMHWNQPIPATFQEKQLKADPGIRDYVVYDLPPAVPHPINPTTTTL